MGGNIGICTLVTGGVRAREKAILDVIRRHVTDGVRQRLLDVGCGDGLFFQPLGPNLARSKVWNPISD